MKIHTILFVFILLFFLFLIFFNVTENLDVNPNPNPTDSVLLPTDKIVMDADVVSNTLTHISSDEQNNRQYVVDRVNQTLTKNENDILVRARRHPPSSQPTSPNTLPPVPVQTENNNNLGFTNKLDQWNTLYYPDAIIGLNGIGLTPSILTKTGTDSYGFTFTKNYVQVQFTGLSKYRFYQIPFVCLQTSVKLSAGSYTLKYNIQARPKASWETDSRSIAIMPMINQSAGPAFLFYRMDNNNKRVSALSDETQLTPQTLKFAINKEDEILLTFVFIVTDPTRTDNCTVALGDIQLLNCEYNTC